MIERNTAELWDGVWTKPATVEKDIYTVDKEERLIRWKRMEAMVLDRFGSFEGLTAIEIGAGRGTNAALMARRGANVTVLDYSDAAMERARRLFEQLELPVEFVRHDALDLPPSIEGKFDLSMSFGLAEHFLDDRRRGILKAHLDVIREGGLTFISVPNAHNPPYRLHKWITERTGRWSVGEEYPFTRKELCDYCEQFGVADFGFFGDSMLRSKKFLNPIKWLPRPKWYIEKRKRQNENSESKTPAAASRSRRSYHRLPRHERGTPLDSHYSYALVLWAIRPRGH